MTDDYTLLGLGELTSIVTGISISAWGSQVLLECIYDPTGDRLPYQLLFQCCREVHFEVHDLEEVGECEADLIGISLGENDYKQPAIIHTDIFEISLLYDRIEISRPFDQGSGNYTEKHHQTTKLVIFR